MSAITPGRMTSDELRRRVETYLLAVDPLVKMAMEIELTQPVTYQVGNDGTIERIDQYGWSTEAKAIYAAVQKEIECLKDLYLTVPRKGVLYARS